MNALERLRCFPSLCLLLLLATAGAPTALAQEDDSPTFRVRYRSADTVYLEAGKAAGLKEGDRLEILRDGEPVAVVEIIFAAQNSSSARLIEEKGEILEGDRARPLGPLSPPPPEPEASQPEPRASATAGGSRGTASRSSSSYRSRERRTRITGVVSLDYETYSSDDGDDEGGDRDVDRTTARLSLRGRDLGGLPLSLRVRMRSQQLERSRALSGGVPESEDRDRLYELSLRWEAPSERWSVQAGRLGVGPFTGIGYLDGASGRVQVLSGWEVGAFYGQRPELADLGLESAGKKYGVFTRFTPSRSTAPWEVFLAGIHEEDDAGFSRELAVLETRLGSAGGRWSLFQRAEIDVSNDLDSLNGGLEEDSSQLTQVALALTGRLGESSRVILSYDRYDPVLLFLDDDGSPARRFEDLLRQGLRARLQFGGDDSLGVSISAGLREGEGDDETTYSAGIGILPARFGGFTVGGDLLAFSNPLTEGGLVTLRARHGFRGGHSVALTLGSTAYSEELTEEDRLTSWARLTGWVELPASLFARGEVEVTTGDDAEGQRLRLGLGYRF